MLSGPRSAAFGYPSGRHGRCQCQSQSSIPNPKPSFESVRNAGVALLAAGGGLTAAVSGIKFTLEAMHPLHLKWELIEDTNKKVSTMEGDMQDVKRAMHDVKQTVDKMDARMGSIETSLLTLTKQSSKV